MAPKFDPKDPAVAALIESFQSIGLSSAKATEAARNAKNAAALKSLIDEHSLADKGLDEKQGVLLSYFAVQGSKLGDLERRYVVDAIVDGRLKSNEQVSAAIKYLTAHPVPINDSEFNSECGVGVNLSPEEVYALVSDYVSSASVEGWSALSSVLGNIKSTNPLRWASTLEIKNSVERVFNETWGPKEASKPKAKESKVPAAQTKSEPAPISEKSVFEEGWLSKLHKPGENPQIHPRLRDAHLAATKGQVFTRFPPEPNGYLHIGHSKAIFVNFGYAAHHGGHCYLRYDDTNPEAEEARYFESILEMIRWLGYEPYRITYSSDYFQELYDLAIELIRRDKAYICHCTGKEINDHRGGKDHHARTACVHRSRPISESLAEFEGMKDGKYRPGEAILRMKQDLEDGNPQMWDLIAYRVLDAPHHRTGSKWRIYPTYDFTHCLVDSFENISHSLCTVEFITARQSYDWLCDALEVYKPRQSEYGRLNLQGTVMSKRKILKLVKGGHVLDWDDPRLYTLIALRRRGVPPAAIISFVGGLGVSTAPSTTETARFDQSIRQYLENNAPRLLMVLRPLKVTLENVPEDYVLMVDKPLHPKVSELGKTTIPFTRTIYIDEEDFRIQDSKDYFRLAPGKTVGLFQGPHAITCTSYKTDPATGKVTELVCRLEDGSTGSAPPKPKAYIQWVAEHKPSGSPVVIDEVRIFHTLFNADNPAGLDDYLQDLNPDSLEVIKGGMVEVGFWPLAKKLSDEAWKEAKERTSKALTDDLTSAPDDAPKLTAEQLVGNECIRFQGLRVAYFALDKEAHLASLKGPDADLGRKAGDKIILNRIVSLKEDSKKNAA
ncbi:hypothetical protein BOTBODRAFT_40718 [Botryobasidium botryosum FD-172 SS1]|uniref:glutamine--tRNA ligase n=1 Tax=Botryobasidium botryosum (strain FD-172 SS1) TaxID=930990 RepID=A0A067N9X0_BOTB1|nr:hypothetical protein BOTBODRAFT_40718 [Botryobasidium botryosum FD-172 SS1]